ncbi:protein-cysteine N-palmitoyltransferase Rasp isoform X1 [Rhipicephalus sanguineus]|uniref:protein-cysteine N-palmitoyltransferase Rasp isoform X1 n=1 Tax=Rhipicephalus sanguineus TaxID=34632 RepID=UPI0020C338BE|nr:protein-cysteine N-palmitoyltransferase Rasp isoform X1 [Rhipicephalus sanguineus]
MLEMSTPVPVDTKADNKRETARASENGYHVVGNDDQQVRWRWTPGKVYHWVLAFGAFAYALGRFATNEESYFLLSHMRSSFNDSPFGLKQRQDNQNWEWRTTKHVMENAWMWYLLHPVLARVTAHVAPSLVFVFYSVYSSLFVTFTFGWEVALLFLAQHAAFYVTASLGSTALCYVVATMIHCQKFFIPFDAFAYMYPRYGLMVYRASYVTFHWNILRGLSFTVDFVQAERRKNTGNNIRRWPSYWKTLGYMLYLPMVYLGPPQKYDDFIAQSEGPKPSCSLREITVAIARLLRNGAHYLLMELMAHYFYSSAMTNWAWMSDRLDYASLAGYALALEFNYYVSYLFTYGFAGSLARVEGIEVPATAPCIARLHRCSRFWRYFDRGMHLWIRRYIYEPVMSETRTAFRLILGTAVAFSFTCTWHSLYKNQAVWYALSIIGIALEVITIQIRKWTPVKNFEKRYLSSTEGMRTAKALLGSPHFLLTICACLFHLADLDVCVNICRRILTGFPFPMVPILVVMYSLCHVSMDVAEWEEASALAKRKQASS